MAEKIELPTYDEVIPNSVWARETELTGHHSLKEECPVTQIVQLFKYKIPSESEIIKLIQTAAKEVQSNSDDKKQKSSISKFLKEIPLEEVRKFAEGEKETIEHLSSHYNTPFQAKRTYILTLNGIVPNRVLDMFNDELEKEEKELLYGELIMRTGKNKWFFTIRLDGRENLPRKDELEFLLEKEVRDCCIFRTDVSLKNYQDMAEQSRLIYDAISTQENIKKIKDYSNKMLKTYTMNTLIDTIECILSQKAIGGFAKGLMGLFGGLGRGLGGVFPFQDDEKDEKRGYDFF